MAPAGGAGEEAAQRGGPPGVGGLHLVLLLEQGGHQGAQRGTVGVAERRRGELLVEDQVDVAAQRLRLPRDQQVGESAVGPSLGGPGEQVVLVQVLLDRRALRGAGPGDAGGDGVVAALDHRGQLPEVGRQGGEQATHLVELAAHLLVGGGAYVAGPQRLATFLELGDPGIDPGDVGIDVGTGHVRQAAYGIGDGPEPGVGDGARLPGGVADDPQRPQGVVGQLVEQPPVLRVAAADQPVVLLDPLATVFGRGRAVRQAERLERLRDPPMEPCRGHRPLGGLEMLREQWQHPPRGVGRQQLQRRAVECATDPVRVERFIGHVPSVRTTVPATGHSFRPSARTEIRSRPGP
ncbi:hypothetical protein SDC9_70092 [bioreactor metagenome]|uniref:Uncharacterized protein n=1 Tax=bioreactor metagenome TaxID=1076179 RepID=A0A644Y6P9_9ZZZZ